MLKENPLGIKQEPEKNVQMNSDEIPHFCGQGFVPKHHEKCSETPQELLKCNVGYSSIPTKDTEKSPQPKEEIKVTSTSDFSPEPDETEIFTDEENILAENEDLLASRRENRVTRRKFADESELRRLRQQLRVSENLRNQMIATFKAGRKRRNLTIRRLKRKVKQLKSTIVRDETIAGN